jgi:hypothetical protein
VASAVRGGTPRPFDAELVDFLAEIHQKVLGDDEQRPADILIAGRDDDGRVRNLVMEQDWDEARAYLVEAFVNAAPPTIP